MCDVLADLTLVIARNGDFGGVVSSIDLVSIDEPVYDLAQEYGVTIARLRATFDYQPGETR